MREILARGMQLQSNAQEFVRKLLEQGAMVAESGRTLNIESEGPEPLLVYTAPDGKVFLECLSGVGFSLTIVDSEGKIACERFEKKGEGQCADTILS